jgi:hypothetical protein
MFQSENSLWNILIIDQTEVDFIYEVEPITFQLLFLMRLGFDP